MASKYIEIGSVIVTEGKPGQKRVSIGLGTKSSKPEYNFSVEMIVKDGTGKVVGRQTDKFINLSDPRTEPDELLAAGFIDEAAAEKMRDRVAGLSPKIKYKLKIPRCN